MNDEPITPDALLEFLKNRRSIRQYRPDPVPDDLLEQILEAGRWAPSASNRQPWEFVVVRDESVRREVAMQAAYYFIRWAHVEQAPVLIVLCGNAGSKIYRQFLHEDIGLAGGQMMLQARALGLGTCWLGGLDRKAIGDVIKLPEDVQVVGLLTLGYPAEDPSPPRRKPLADIVHYDTYGNQSKDGDVTPGKIKSGPLGILVRHLRLPFRI
ncbi:MAG: nitroreductase family protein [Anaerolineales bacterium]|nr:nitroreductase family protein [Anaerolineales bacterium]